MANVIENAGTYDASLASASGWSLDGIDPRTRLIAAVGFSLLVTVVNSLPTLVAALAVAVVGASWTGALGQQRWKRLIPVNLLVLMLLGLLPLSGGATPVISIGTLVVAREGLVQALWIGVKANAIVLGVLVVLARLEMASIGHALGSLGVPEKLTHLLLFTVRYLGVIQREYTRLWGAMKTRGFRPRFDWHTYRSFGYLVGMLLLRSVDRADRIVAAMKCRGFCGRFPPLDHAALTVRDVWFSAIVLLLLAGLAALEWA
jgi:cobalt/nickel transport system permease protein